MKKVGGQKKVCCNSKCINSSDLVETTALARIYFGVKKVGRSWICKKCEMLADTFVKEAKQEVKAKGNLFSVKLEALEEVIDLDPDPIMDADADEVNESDMKPLYAVSNDELTEEINAIFRRVSIVEHADKLKATVANEIDALANDFGEMEKELKELDQKFFQINQSANKAIGLPTLIELGTVDISETEIKIQENENLNENLKLAKIGGVPKAVHEFRKTVTASIDRKCITPGCSRTNVVLRNTSCQHQNAENTPPKSCLLRQNSNSRSVPTGKSNSRVTTDIVETNTSGLTYFENSGCTQKVRIPANCPSPKALIPHTCSHVCCFPYVEEDFRKISPLVIPFHLGWARQLTGAQFNVSYITPCGLSLAKYVDIHAYNRKTQNNIPVEFFALESTIDCLNEFKPERDLVSIKDISYGKEWTPVQCINSIDHTLPESLDYYSFRKPGDGVNVNLDDGFMVCCDCEDDCKDKSKCACWQLTLSGYSFKKKRSLQGYEHRRLKDRLESGIYECNHKCKCRSNTCLNRVVQSKVKWPVQVFKTIKKGWGVRALYDIPRGSFLCVYTGKLLNDTAATEEGLRNGDEYLADLDYVEVMELQKPGYESDCSDLTDDDDSDSGPMPTPRGVMMRLQVARKSTGGRKEQISNRPDEGHEQTAVSQGHRASNGKSSKALRYRSYFGKFEKPYSVDGKGLGNFGRYFNHSCDPNVFIQNVFVDTHDLRFPWVAFFTSSDVKAGTELCWDYKYQVGSVPGKSLKCFCGAKKCRGRLL